jgi:hypothetical protein
MKNIIYGLKDPRNDVYCYIGKSTVGDKRALSHLTRSHSVKVQEWIKELDEMMLYPIIEIIEEVEDLNDLAKKEIELICYYHTINPNLLNVKIVSKNLLETRPDSAEEEFQGLCRTIVFIHDILKKERIYRNMTQQEMADEMGISRSTLSLMERGENTTLFMIRKYLLHLKGFDLITKVNYKRSRKRNSEKTSIASLPE